MATADLTARLLAFAHVLVEEEYDLSVEELICFLTIASKPGLSVGELASETSLPQSTVSRHLKGLSSRHHHSRGGVGPIQWELKIDSEALVDQRVHPANAKQKALHVNEKGQELLQRFERALKGSS